MLADVHILHKSDVYKISDFRCHCNICSITQPEYNHSLCISFTRKGFFEYRTFKRNDEVHLGRILISKPEYEHTTRHIDDQPDVVTVFEFTSDYFQKLNAYCPKEAGWFLKNNDLHAIMLACSVELDYLHHRILQALQAGQRDNLLIDEMVMELLNQVLLKLGNVTSIPIVPDGMKKHHLSTIEKAKEYMLENFRENISLQSLAEHCFVSPFHFSRIFKMILGISPHQYLLSIRLNHAKILLTSSARPVRDIAFDCGFNSLEHFVTAYRQQFGFTPGQHRSVVA